MYTYTVIDNDRLKFKKKLQTHFKCIQLYLNKIYMQ